MLLHKLIKTKLKRTFSIIIHGNISTRPKYVHAFYNPDIVTCSKVKKEKEKVSKK